jgi:hypothetical protein
MYERRLEHSLYKTIAELQRLRLLRQIDPPANSAAPEPKQPTASPPPHRAKQTQFRNTPSRANQPQSKELVRNQHLSRVPKQTQSNPIPTTRPAEFHLPRAHPAVSSVPSAPLLKPVRG